MAAKLARTALSQGSQSTVSQLRDELEYEVCTRLPYVKVIGASSSRLPNTSQLLFPRTDGKSIVYALAQRGICVGTGSACSAGAESPSHVLLAMGIPHDDAWRTIRCSLSSYSTRAEVLFFVDTLTEVLAIVQNDCER